MTSPAQAGSNRQGGRHHQPGALLFLWHGATTLGLRGLAGAAVAGLLAALAQACAQGQWRYWAAARVAKRRHRRQAFGPPADAGGAPPLPNGPYGREKRAVRQAKTGRIATQNGISAKPLTARLLRIGRQKSRKAAARHNKKQPSERYNRCVEAK